MCNCCLVSYSSVNFVVDQNCKMVNILLLHEMDVGKLGVSNSIVATWSGVDSSEL